MGWGQEWKILMLWGLLESLGFLGTVSWKPNTLGGTA